MMAVDHDALEAALPRHAIEFRDRGRGIADRQRRETEKSSRMAPDSFGESVIRVARNLLCILDLELLDARRRQRQRLNIDARGVHRGHARVADVEQLLDEFCRHVRFERPARSAEKSRRREMLLKSDRSHCAGLL